MRVHFYRRREFLLFTAFAIAAVTQPASTFGLTRRTRSRRKIIVIDPGHGGADPGAISIGGAYEKNIALSVAQRLHGILKRSPRLRVYLTRKDDVFIPLQERVARAHALHADLFVSIHADSIPDPRMRGASVFTLSEKASDKYAAEVAARENKDDLLTDIDLSRQTAEVSNILVDLARRETANRSISLAHFIAKDLRRHGAVLDPCLRSAGFVVLKTLEVPAVLVEIGCLSNRTEERQLRSPRYQQGIASAVARGIKEYCGGH